MKPLINSRFWLVLLLSALCAVITAICLSSCGIVRKSKHTEVAKYDSSGKTVHRYEWETVTVEHGPDSIPNPVQHFIAPLNMNDTGTQVFLTEYFKLLITPGKNGKPGTVEAVPTDKKLSTGGGNSKTTTTKENGTIATESETHSETKVQVKEKTTDTRLVWLAVVAVLIVALILVIKKFK